MELHKERAHREALEACSDRAAVVDQAIAKLIAYIEDHPENPVFLTTAQRRIELLTPLVPAADDQTI